MKKLIHTIFRFYPLEKLLVLLNSGKEYGSFLTKLTPNHTDYSKGSLRSVTRAGIRYDLDISNIVDWYIYFDFKERAHSTLLSLIKTTDTVIDIGANIGLVSLKAAKIATRGKIHGFEPFPATFDRLANHITINNLSNVALYNIGLGNQDGELPFETDFEGNPGMYRIGTTTGKASTKVKVRKLDDVAGEQHITRVDLIKIDVEGYEFEVLKGAEKIIRDHKPVLFIEVDDEYLKNQHSSAKELIAWLQEKGYSIQNALTDEPIEYSQDFSNCHLDVIAFP